MFYKTIVRDITFWTNVYSIRSFRLFFSAVLTPKVIKMICPRFILATAPNCNKNAERARLRRAHHLGHNKEKSEWSKTLDSNKYPKCVGKNLFEDCPTKVPEVAPSTCKSCPQYIPSIDERKERMRKLMEVMKNK